VLAVLHVDNYVRGIVADEDEELLVPVGVDVVPLHGGLEEGGGADAQLHVGVRRVAAGNIEESAVSVW